ncbi:MAG: DUF192 domain-containing protein [Thermomicrobiales bacterium]
MKRAIVVLVVLLTVSLGFASASPASAAPIRPPWRFQLPWKTASSKILVGSDALKVEVADTNYLRSRGLSYRDELVPRTGMLFVFNEAMPLTFWMYEMRFCLDIIWINDGQIRGAAESVCPMPGTPADQLPIYASPEPVRYVLEVPAGWMRDHGYGVGTPVQIDSSLRDKDDPS